MHAFYLSLLRVSPDCGRGDLRVTFRLVRSGPQPFMGIDQLNHHHSHSRRRRTSCIFRSRCCISLMPFASKHLESLLIVTSSFIVFYILSLPYSFLASVPIALCIHLALKQR